MGIKFDKTAALGADKGGYISESGVYEVSITEAVITKGTEQTTFVEFSFEDDSGATANFCRLCTRKKNGEKSFGTGIVQSLMGLLNVEELTLVPKTDGDREVQQLKEFIGKKTKVALQREEYIKNDNTTGWKMVPLHFFDVKTGQTYGEKVDDLPAKIILAEIKTKSAPAVSNKASSSSAFSNGVFVSDDSGLPF